MKIKILLADDHTLFRQGIRTLISCEADLEVIGEAGDATEAVTMANELRPDLVLLDISMPGASSFEAARQMVRNRPEMKIVFLTMYDDEDYLLEAMQSGASGYVLKDSPSTQLLCAIRDAFRGGSYLSPRMLKQLVADFRYRVKADPRENRQSTLTHREREILKYLAEGNSAKQIAGFLNLSVKTVEAHKFNLMRKLDIHNAAQLVQYAIQKKVIQIPVLA